MKYFFHSWPSITGSLNFISPFKIFIQQSSYFVVYNSISFDKAYSHVQTNKWEKGGMYTKVLDYISVHRKYTYVCDCLCPYFSLCLNILITAVLEFFYSNSRICSSWDFFHWLFWFPLINFLHFSCVYCFYVPMGTVGTMLLRITVILYYIKRVWFDMAGSWFYW